LQYFGVSNILAQVRKVLLPVLFLIFAGSKSSAQDNYVISSYGVDDGLPQSTIWSITQDRNGFMWFGTSDGLCRFDGFNFTTYRSKPDDSTSVIGGLYFRFYLDSSGELWIISQNGISLYDDARDKFKRVFSYKKDQPSPDYNCIFGEDRNYVWAGISERGIVKIDKRTHAIIDIRDSVFKTNSTFSSWQCGFISDDKIWAAGSQSDCYAYNMRSGMVNKTNVPYLYKIIDFNDSEVLGATLNELIIFSKKDFSHKVIPISKNLYAGYERLTDIFVQSPSTIIMGSPKGLFFLDTHSWKITRSLQSFTPGRHSYTYVQCIFRDRSDNLWIGTNGDGLKKIAAPNKKFKYYTSYNENSNIVKSIYADERNLYVGYFNNGLDVFSRKNGFERNVSMRSLGISLNHLYAIAPIDSNRLLINPAGEDFLFEYSIKTNRVKAVSTLFRRIVPDFDRLQNNYPFLLRQGATIYTVLASYLLTFEVEPGGDIKVALAHNFEGEKLTCSFRDHKGVVWAGSLNGLFCLANGRVERKVLPEVVQVKSINEDGAGNLWVGTIRGIYVLDSNKKIKAYYTEKNGLSSQFIYGILRDNDGNMWFSHNKGLSVYNCVSGNFRHFTRDDGLQSNEFNTGAYYKAADGELFFGGINGVNSFYPGEIMDNPNTPETRITSIKLFDEPLRTDSAYWSIRSLVLPYNENSLSFEFAAMEFTNAKKNQYAYLLEGLDKAWIKAGDKRFARYAGLQPGEYVFKVKASNNDGVWQQQPTVVYITIVPPYWQRWWFRILMVFAGIATTAGVIVQIQRARHKRRIRALELQQKIQQERERISRDLHDNVGTQLSLISNNIEWVTHPLKNISNEEKEEKLQFVNDSARDIISTLRETIWALKKEKISLEEFADKLKAFVQKQLTLYPGIQLNLTEEIEGANVLGPSEALNLFRICQEALANTLKYAEASEIEIRITGAAGKYTIDISDNGRGFDPDGVNASVQNGLENMSYRATDIDCQLEISTSVGKGTRITLRKK